MLLHMIISIGILDTNNNFTNLTELYNNSLVILIPVIYTN